jgi:hypothetical protein
LPGKSHIIERMREDMARFKSLIPSRGRAKAPVRPDREVKCSEFADCIIADM